MVILIFLLLIFAFWKIKKKQSKWRKKDTYFVVGISTEVGKTIVSAILTEALEADYWKPIQSGDLENSDTDKVRRLISNTRTVFHPNSYALHTPASPHLQLN